MQKKEGDKHGNKYEYDNCKNPAAYGCRLQLGLQSIRGPHDLPYKPCLQQHRQKQAFRDSRLPATDLLCWTKLVVVVSTAAPCEMRIVCLAAHEFTACRCMMIPTCQHIKWYNTTLFRICHVFCYIQQSWCSSWVYRVSFH